RWRERRCNGGEGPDMRYGDEMDEPGDVGHSELLAKLLVPVSFAGHVLFYDVLPAALTWIAGSPKGLDLFSAFEHPALRRLAGIGIFLSVIAAVITTESVTRLARPFSVRHFLVTVVLIGGGTLPPPADWHRVRPRPAPRQFRLLPTDFFPRLWASRAGPVVAAR